MAFKKNIRNFGSQHAKTGDKFLRGVNRISKKQRR